MFLITFRSRLNPKSRRAAEFRGMAGAYVNCWISFKDYEASVKLAKILIRERGFIPELRTDSWEIQKRRLKTKKEKQFYAEALKYGFCLVFYLWPDDAPDAQADYEAEERLKKHHSSKGHRAV